MKTTSLDEQTARNKRSDSGYIQADNPSMTLMVNIFRRYEGVIGEQTFQNLLGEIEKAVFDNKLPPIIFDILKGLEVRGFFDTPLKPLIDWYKIRREQGMGYWPSEDTIQEHIRKQDQQQKMDMFTTWKILNTLADENRLNEEMEKKVPQHHLVDANNLNDEDTSSLLWVIKNTRFYKESDLRQLMYQRNIREIQRRIIYHQRKAQQLQLQQLFLNNKKQEVKLQRVIGQQRGPFMEMHELDQICNRLQEQELKLLDMQLNFHRTIENLQHELIKQEEMLQQCLEDDRNKDKIFNI